VPFLDYGKFTRHERNIWKWFHNLVVPVNSSYKSLSVSFQAGGVTHEIEVGKVVQRDGSTIEVGVFNPLHAILLSTLMKRYHDVARQGFSEELDEPIYTNFDEFRDASGRTHGSCTNAACEFGLRTLNQVPIRWKMTFETAIPDEDNSSKFQTQTIALIEDMHILSRLVWVVERPKKGAKKGRRPRVAFKYKFHDKILEHLKIGYTLPYNHASLVSIKSDTAVQFFNHLEVMMVKKTHYKQWSLDIFKTLHLDSVRNKKASNRRAILESVKKHILRKSFSHGTLSGMSWEWHPDRKDFLILWKKSTFAQISNAKIKMSEARAVVDQLLDWVGETTNEKTRGYLFTSIKKKGLHQVYDAGRRVKTDYLDNRSMEVEARPGYLLWKEIDALPELKT